METTEGEEFRLAALAYACILPAREAARGA